MKKSIRKKILSGFIACIMLVSVGYNPVYASELGEQNVSSESEENENIESTLPDEIETGETSEYVEKSEVEDDTVGEEAEGAEKTILLNYMILEHDYVETPSTQYIIADVGDESTVISKSVLTYENVTTGISYQKEADILSGGTMLFELSFISEQAGQYQVTTLVYQTEDSKEHTINIEETGATAVFGVDTKVDVNPYAWILEKEDSETIEACTNFVQEDASNMSLLTKSDSGNLVVVLDPGHGGTDSGASRTWNGITYTERELNLKIAQYCKEELEKYDNVTVYMTRTDNEKTLSLTERTNYAKSVNADVLVSLHINATASESTTVTGAEVIIPNASYNAEIHNIANELGNVILSKLEELGITNRGTWSRDTTIGELYPDGSVADYYTIIYNSKMNGIPGIIVEHAYISNEADCIQYLGSDDKLKQIGIQDASAIAEYYNLNSDVFYMYNGVDYRSIYNYGYYINQYPDIKAAFEGNPQGALAHFVNYGMKEGRQGCEDFNVTYYKNRYVDLRNAFGNNLESYYQHYINCGKQEGRDGKSYSELTGTVTQFNGVDYSAVYDFNYYINKYSKVKQLYSKDDVGAIQYFVTQGMNDGQQAKASFNVTSYGYRYPDLRRAFKNDLKQYYLHYISCGKREGRTATGTMKMQGGTTTYNGVDYSAVYNVGYYANKYADLRNAFGFDDEAYLQHFVACGMREGRQAINTFNVTSYRYEYPDLRVAFESNLPLYYLHYINCGKAEGRHGTGTTSIQNPVTSLDGIDYSLVYDYNYYVNKYADIKQVFGEDDVAVLKHFITFGMNEGRQGNAEFIVSYYRSNYIDLQNAYGSNLALYYLHFISDGKKEGRIANQQICYGIMGTSSVTVEQMVAYYNAHATYPAFYANSDAPDIRTFCQLYMEECNAEGVKTEVAFCQAMLETGFLSYGGDVSISQYNFAGLGATGGVPGLSFSSVREGIRAQVQHLKAYASTEPLNNACVDPRFGYVTRGCAPYVEWLGIKENPYGFGWASAKSYGYTIKNNYIYSLLAY
ncbi:MAG: N-acetylmuramoyl-L-alanine amidase [Lachnospiraceae bacterium]|nr:N-acetylmuramoyl-L-alanine amidase [Lachnospiraceae bacterium]